MTKSPRESSELEKTSDANSLSTTPYHQPNPSEYFGGTGRRRVEAGKKSEIRGLIIFPSFDRAVGPSGIIYCTVDTATLFLSSKRKLKQQLVKEIRIVTFPSKHRDKVNTRALCIRRLRAWSDTCKQHSALSLPLFLRLSSPTLYIPFLSLPLKLSQGQCRSTWRSPR